MKKTEYHGVCVISRTGGGIIGLACCIRVAKALPKQASRINGSQENKTYWFGSLLEAQAFYDKMWTKIRRTA